MLKEELTLLSEPGSHVAEVAKVMSKTKVLVKVVLVAYNLKNAKRMVFFLTQINPEGKHVVDIDPSIDISKVNHNMSRHIFENILIITTI